MATSPASSSGAVVLDANIAIAVCANEVVAAKVQTSLFGYASRGFDFYAPGVLVAETLYVLCQKSQTGTLSTVAHAAAVTDFAALLTSVLPPPLGDASLMLRAEHIRSGYGCSHSADGLYIALAKLLAQTQTTVLLTMDVGLSKQAAQNSPAVVVDLITR